MNIDSVSKALERSGDGVDMERPVTVVSRELVYQGAISASRICGLDSICTTAGRR